MPHDLSLANAAWELATRTHGSFAGTHCRPAGTDRAGPALGSLRSDLFFRAGSQRHPARRRSRLPYRPVPHDLDKAVFYDGVYGGHARARRHAADGLARRTHPHHDRGNHLKRQSGQRTIIFTLLSWGCALTGAIAIVGWVAAGRGLAPLNRLQNDLAQRSLRDLTPIDESQVPIEVRPLAAAVNALLERIAEAAKAQQGFLADVAHQLRTPLAGSHHAARRRRAAHGSAGTA